MFHRNLLAGLAAGLLLCVQTGMALAAVPKDAPKDVKHILGFYYGNGENILIRENNGRLELLYRFSYEDNNFSGANVFPLSKEHFDSYSMIEAGPMNRSEATVKFERDNDGYGIACRVGGHTYSREYFGFGVGEREKPFRFPELSAEKWAELRTSAANAVMPAALAVGAKADLVNAAFIPGVKVNSVYAQEANCFGAPLYTTNAVYMSRGAAEALGKVQQKMAERGYGVVLWDGYRPWSVSKLAHLALPDNRKGMLEDPDLKGSTHNTGCAVDVGLYDLTTGAELELSSGFDEPTIRQYSSYAGGTSRQRYLRGLLRDTMELYGFKGIEMEWWHFEYGDISQSAHLNIPLEQLHN